MPRTHILTKNERACPFGIRTCMWYFMWYETIRGKIKALPHKNFLDDTSGQVHTRWHRNIDTDFFVPRKEPRNNKENAVAVQGTQGKVTLRSNKKNKYYKMI